MSYATPDTAPQTGHSRSTQSRIRLINIQPRGATLTEAHRAALGALLLTIRGKNVSKVMVDAFANNDTSVANRRAESVANALEAIARQSGIELAGKIWRTSFNSATAQRSKPGKNEAYWRGVDIYLELGAPAPAPRPTPDATPPYPGNRHPDWEVYAAWGNQFTVGPVASIGFNVYHFRRKANHNDADWFFSIMFGAGLSADKDHARMAAQGPQLVRLVRKVGISRLSRMLQHVPGPARSAALATLNTLKGAAGTFSEPGYSNAPTTYPINLRDLQGATVSTAGGELKASIASYASATMNVRAKIPIYELKLRDRKVVWVDKSVHTNLLIMDKVDIGGWGGQPSAWPEASLSFVGGPLLRM